jgi:carbonic anhydrase/acetyltransferase-like protein (isoleucine patch superfamily)
MVERILKLIKHFKNKVFYNINTDSNSYVFGKVFMSKKSILTVGKNCRINSIEIIGEGTVVIGNNVEIRDVFINLGKQSKLTIGNNVFIGKHSKFIIYGECSIGDDILIAPDVLIVDNDHIISSKVKVKDSGLNIQNILISNNVWIGAKSVITKGVVIEENCVIGSLSVVNKNCEKNFIYAGVPSKKLKSIENE